MAGFLQADVEIVVEPPLVVGVNRWLVPPVVARTRDPQLVDDYLTGSKTIFATAMLYSSTMDDYTSSLGGNWNVTAQLINAVSSSSRGDGSSSRSNSEQWLYFIFNPVSVNLEGLFSFNIVISALTSPSSEGAGMSQVVGGKPTRFFNVVAHPPRVEKPSKPSKGSSKIEITLIYHTGSSERQLLRHLQAAGLYTPISR